MKRKSNVKRKTKGSNLALQPEAEAFGRSWLGPDQSQRPRKSHVKRKPKQAPRIKKVKLTEAVVLHVEVPPKMIPAIVPGPDPHVMRIVPLPPEKAQTWMEYFFGPERK